MNIFYFVHKDVLWLEGSLHYFVSFLLKGVTQ